MGILSFDFNKLMPIISHTLNSTEFVPTIQQTMGDDFVTRKPESEWNLKPAFHLTKSYGVFICSNGKQRLKQIDFDNSYKESVIKHAEKEHQSLFFDEHNRDIWRDKIHLYAKYKLMSPLDWAIEVNAVSANKQYVVWADGHDSSTGNYFDSGQSDYTDKLCGYDNFVHPLEFGEWINKMVSDFYKGKRKNLYIEVSDYSFKCF